MKPYDDDPFWYDRGPAFDPQPIPQPRVRRARLLAPLGRMVLFASATGIVAAAAVIALSRWAGIFVP